MVRGGGRVRVRVKGRDRVSLVVSGSGLEQQAEGPHDAVGQSQQSGEARAHVQGWEPHA